MLRRSKRIQKRDYVQQLIKNGEETKSPLFFLKHVKTERTYCRFAIVISKKVEKSAVKRNRKRRQIYEILRLYEKSVPNLGSSDIILLARKKVMTLSFDELTRAVTMALNTIE